MLLGASAMAVFAAALSGEPRLDAKEFLTPKEIEKIQDAPEVDKRVKVYMDAAVLRLKAAEERITGKESAPGDPLEFFSVEDMLDGYYRIVRSVMFTLDEAAERPGGPGREPDRISKALKTLKDGTEKNLKDLAVLQKLAEEKQNEQAYKLVAQALEIAGGAQEGAETGLARFKSSQKERKKSRR